MKRFPLLIQFLMIAFAVNGQSISYNYQWLTLGSTDNMSVRQVATWRTDADSQSAVAEIAPATCSPNISPRARAVEVSSSEMEDYGIRKIYHTAVFDNLNPGSRYLYRIGDGDGHWSEWFNLNTAETDNSEFSFIYMADVQSGIVEQYPRVIRKAVMTVPDAAFIVFTGDLTERALNWQYEDFFNAHGWILAEKPMVAVPDNHEYPMNEFRKREKLGTFWGHMFSHPENAPERLAAKGFFTFDYQGCRFIMLNTREFEEFTEGERETAFGWIEGLLSDNPCGWTIVAQHKPIYSVADKRHSNEDIRRLKDLYEKYKVDLVISGHDHVYSRAGRFPVCVTSVGGSGQYAPAYSGIHDRIGSDAEFFQKVSVSGKELRLDTYDALGELYDSFKISRRAGKKRFHDMAPDREMRTNLPPTRMKKYTAAAWSRLDSLRREFVGAKDWKDVKKIERSIVPPVFRNAAFEVVSYGAAKDGITNDRPAIQKAIDVCADCGGGKVVLSPGKYFCEGPIKMRSNVNLHFEEGAELIFSTDEKSYLPLELVRWEGTEVFNYSPMIYGRDLVNVAITGKGIINGRGAEHFEKWKTLQKPDQQALRKMGVDGTPVNERIFGEGHYLRPAMVDLLHCENILLEDLTLVDCTFWSFHLSGCNNAIARRLKVDCTNLNSDGIDPDSSTNVLIEDCFFHTGDDGIAVKSGRDQDGWRMAEPTENVIIRRCTFDTESNGLCIGSEISGGVRNVFMYDCRIKNAKQGIYIKSNLDRGGYIEDIHFRNIRVSRVTDVLLKIDSDYKSESKGNYPTSMRNFEIRNVKAESARCGIYAKGFEQRPIENLSIRNLTLKEAEQTCILRDTSNLVFKNVRINGKRITPSSY